MSTGRAYHPIAEFLEAFHPPRIASDPPVRNYLSASDEVRVVWETVIAYSGGDGVPGVFFPSDAFDGAVCLECQYLIFIRVSTLLVRTICAKESTFSET